jgi:hypothetical protein
MSAREARGAARPRHRARKLRWMTLATVVVAGALLALAASRGVAGDDDGDDDDDDDDDDHGSSGPAVTVNGACAVDATDGRTWCAYANVVAGIDVAFSAVDSTDVSRVDHYVKATFSGTKNPGSLGWASFGPGTSMSSAVVSVGQANGASSTTYTLTSRATPSNVCSAGCAITELATTSDASGLTLKFRYTKENTTPGTETFIWGMKTSAWPGKHSAFGTVSADVTGITTANSGTSTSTLTRDVTHGVLMVMAWVIFMPGASAMTMLKNALPDGLWFKLHMAGASIGSLIFAIALGLLLGREDHGESSLLDTHYTLALGTIGLWVAQISLGVLRPNKTGGNRLGFIPTSLRPAWFVAHRVIGPLVMGIAAAAVITGAKLIQDKHGDDSAIGIKFLMPDVMYAMYATVVALALVGAGVNLCCFKPRQRSTSPSAPYLIETGQMTSSDRV